MPSFHNINPDDDFLNINNLGERKFKSPLMFYPKEDMDSGFVQDGETVLLSIEQSEIELFTKLGKKLPAMEKAGPRKKLYFEPGKTNSAIVTCGGLCPGLNAVIRGLVMINHYRYKNNKIYGIPYGYSGFKKDCKQEVIELTPDLVKNINEKGGTILGSSRGEQDSAMIVDRLLELDVQILYAIGGDGTQRGAWDIQKEIQKRGLNISVIGLPKTIDNDINYIDKSFGMETAYSTAVAALSAAHTEAQSFNNGVGLVKLMGRDSGFVAAYAALASNEVNFCLVPELDFDLEGDNGFLHHLYKRLDKGGHALVVVAEGTGQHFMKAEHSLDASGNIKLNDIGVYLKDRIKSYLETKDMKHTVKYIDPSYMIRSVPPNPSDAVFCTQLAQMAVHAGMSGKTGLVIGYINGKFTHLPTPLAIKSRKKINLYSTLWTSVIEATGQPLSMKNE